MSWENTTTRRWGEYQATIRGQKKLSRQEELLHLLIETKGGLVFDWMTMSLAVIAYLIFVAETYREDPAASSSVTVVCLELFFCMVFLIDYLLHLLCAESKLSYVFSWHALIDLATILPALFFLCEFKVEVNDDICTILWRVFRSTRILRLYRIVYIANKPVKRQVLKLSYTIGALLFFFAALNCALFTHFNWHTSLYFMTVTFTTVGYGDISPQGTLGRMLFIVIMATAFVVVPAAASDLFRIMSEASVYKGSYHKQKKKEHVVICGSMSYDVILDFLSEFFHKDHEENDNYRVVILGTEDKPNIELEILLSMPFYQSRVKYLSGSVLIEKDLARVKLKSAKAVFVMANKFRNPDDEDAETILRTLSILKYHPQCNIFVQLLKPENQLPLLSVGLKEDRYICINEMKQNIVAQSCSGCQGFSTLVINLLRSYSISSLDFVDCGPWEREYAYGVANEVYKVEFSKHLQGMTFSEASSLLYSRYSIILFAVAIQGRKLQGSTELDDHDDDKRERIVTNPGESYRIDSDMDVGFVLSQDPELAKRVATYDPQVDDHVVLPVVDDNQRVPLLSSTPSSPLSSRAQQLVEGAYGALSTMDMEAARKKKLENIYNKSIKLSRVSNLRRSASNLFDEPPTHAGKSKSKPKRKGSRTKLAVSFNIGGTNNDGSGFLSSEPSTYNNDNNETSTTRTEYNQNSGLPTEQKASALSSESSEIPTGEDRIRLEGHIVLSAPWYSVARFVEAVRASPRHSRDANLPPVGIVIMNLEPPTTREWAKIENKVALHYLQGSLLDADDLKRANLKKASAVVLLKARESVESRNNTLEEKYLSDASSIMAISSMHLQLPTDVLSIVELVYQGNMRFLRGEQGKMGTFTPSFAAGRIYWTSSLDALICQAFYNPFLIPLIEELVSGSLSARPLETNKGGSELKRSSVFQLKLPPELAGKSFEHAYKHLCVANIVLIGLLRSPETLNAPMPYVLTAPPPPNTFLHARDRLFVLSHPSNPLLDVLLYDSQR
eukprot:TRINITY_DN8802_c0_g1_i2.p1 TRINITY_DN8802_c0_g1~~TRINITY_DN8802_c0_g1_i2.p1  ORF type:complete len:1025 (-),score=213.06 TRINITY_DN8802_c0_g1_i2:98-3130(-)